ncbi:MAG: transcription elongation factor GreA [Candidatus Omnitrophica bacterium]|nr:transcription elongation factor GreA [Candidatus Omnitrophota bacterium]
MGAENIYLTREGYDKLIKKLKRLKTIKRRELSKEIGIARAFGDISENAEYTAAKEAQGLNEKKIAELETKLVGARILDTENIPKDKAFIGATVKLKDLDSGEEFEYTLVAEVEADFEQGKISVSSPVGKGLLGHKENETVKIKIPAGVLKYKILKISR